MSKKPAYPTEQSIDGNPTFVVVDVQQGRRVSDEQQRDSAYREQNRTVAMPADITIYAEGSWLNNPRNPKY